MLLSWRLHRHETKPDFERSERYGRIKAALSFAKMYVRLYFKLLSFVGRSIYTHWQSLYFSNGKGFKPLSCEEDASASRRAE